VSFARDRKKQQFYKMVNYDEILKRKAELAQAQIKNYEKLNSPTWKTNPAGRGPKSPPKKPAVKETVRIPQTLVILN
jgi:hypothetical protein